MVLIFLSYSFFLSAQNIVLYSNLNFHSDFEKQTFKKLKSKTQKDKLSLLLTTRASIQSDDIKKYETQLEQLYAKLESKRIRKKKLKKQVKILFDYTHDVFFKKYKDYAEIHETFDDGIYNCVTASAIYALTLDHFGIAYEIRDLPTHVYIVVDPKGEQIVLESTDPINGVYTIDKKEYIKRLVDMKVISKDEIRKNTINELYEKYTETNEKSIDFAELVGDLYYNAAIESMQMEFFNKALDQINKSLFLYAAQSAEYTKMAILANLANQFEIEKIETYSYLFDMLIYEEYQEAIKEHIEMHFSQIAQKYLIDEYDKKAYLQRHQYFINRLKGKENDDILNAVQLLHFQQLAYSSYLRTQKQETLIYLDSAFQIGPKNLTIQSFIGETIFEIGKEMSLNESYGYLLKKQEAYPFLVENENINFMILVGASSFVSDAFIMNDEKLGFEKFELFNQRNNSIKSLSGNIRSLAIGRVYASIHSYYVRKSDFKAAEDWILKGLKLAPSDEELLRKKKIFDEYMANRRK